MLYAVCVVRGPNVKASYRANVDCLSKVDDQWLSLGSTSAAGWPTGDIVGRLDLAPRHVQLEVETYFNFPVGSCEARYFLVGADAHLAEVAQAGVLTRHRLERPTSAIVLAAEHGTPFEMRILDRGVQTLYRLSG